MLKEMILINSAEFDYAKIDLTKDIFFAGDNGTGKTSTIIALFYLFSGDNNSRKLGISSDKKSFKEYYFPDEKNSFIIYVFEDFFIFTYKQNGEIFKRFSKQKFNIEKIVNADGKLKTFKDIQLYLKDTPLTYLAKSSEYRDIIYGQNRHYLDFKITSIKNYDVFVELFNQTFNVDKSIVDANSIKRAIQKSLNIEEKNIEFNYQKYMDEIKKFQESYLFFRKFDKESNRIANSFKLQEEILTLEKNIEDLSAQILYKEPIEQKLLEEKREKIARLTELNSQYELKREQKQKSLNRMRERFAKEIATVEKEIADIKRLKKKFEPQTYQAQQKIFNELPILEKEYQEKQQRLTLLEADMLNALNSIDQDISALNFKRENELSQQKKIQIEQLKAQINDSLAQEKERQKNELEHTEHHIESQQKHLKVQIDALEISLEEEKKKGSKLHNHYNQQLNLFNEEQFKVKNTIQKEIEEREEELRAVKRELNLFKEERESLKKGYKKRVKNMAQKLWDERRHLNQTIKEQKAILFTQEGSFKEFLQQSGLSWEKELYPFMDASLLAISTKKLSPTIINSEMPLGIKLDPSHLKAIPTQEEAEESIREAKVKKQQLLKSYKEEKQKLNENYNIEQKEIEQNIKHKLKDLELLEKKVEEHKKEITTINTITIPNYEKSQKEEKQEKLNAIERDIDGIKAQIKGYKENLERLKKELNNFINIQQKSIKKYQEELFREHRKGLIKIESWLKNEEEKIEKFIAQKQKNRKSFSKDEVITDLRSRLEELKIKLQKANDAKYYLQEYDKSKEFIDTLSQRESRLIISQQNRENIEHQLLKKEEELVKSTSSNEEAIKSLTEEIKKVELGLEKRKTVKVEATEPKESKQYLVELIESYRQTKTSHKELRINLKELLSSINNLKNNPFTEINFNLENFSLFSKLSEDFETLEKLSELKDFKDKKLEILKETSNEKYFNFIKSEIPSKLGSLSHSEDKFQEQVKKINKNLETIDFSIIKGIKINPEIGNKRSIMTLLNEMENLVQNLTISDDKESLFFNKPRTNQDLQKIANLLGEIKDTLKGGAITLLDTIDLSLEFTENGTTRKNVTQIKNESSTGGTILLKMALAVSILGLYTQEKESTFFLILDEVSRLHSHNQDLLRGFANSRGFRIVFVTPEPVYAKPDEIKYYKFMRREDNRFEIVGLNG